MGRLDLAGGVDVDEGGIEAVTAAIRRPFDAPQVDGDLFVGAELGERVEMARFDLNGVVHVVGVDIFLHGGVELGAVGAFDPERVAGEEGFAEGDELGLLVGRLADIGEDFVEGGGAVEPHRGDLGEGDGEGVGHGEIL